MDDLRKECKDIQFSTKGYKATLIKSLRENSKNRVEATTATGEEETEIDAEFDAILATRVKTSGKDALQQALGQDHYVEEAGGELVVGNRRGLNLAGLPAQIALLQDHNASQDQKIALLQAQVASLQAQNASLASSLPLYKILRNRFISTFKQDILKNATDVDRRIIAAGNTCAHGGDAAADAMLYQGMSGRCDFSSYKRLYGKEPGPVLLISESSSTMFKITRLTSLGYQPTINALNTHAEVIASKHKRGTAEFYEKFAKFIKLLDESDDPSGYLDGDTTDLSQAYWSFVSCVKDQVTRVEAADANDG